MNIFYEKFPSTIVVGGKTYGIITDFREWIKLIDMFKDKFIDEELKANLLSMYFTNEIPIIQECIPSIIDFLSLKDYYSKDNQENSENKNEKPVFSYYEDAGFIVSGFMECYGIDLLRIPYMHWWKFRILFDGLNENTEIKKRIMYRSIDASTIKDKNERARIRKIQQNIALEKGIISDYDIGNAFS